MLLPLFSLSDPLLTLLTLTTVTKDLPTQYRSPAFVSKTPINGRLAHHDPPRLWSHHLRQDDHDQLRDLPTRTGDDEYSRKVSRNAFACVPFPSFFFLSCPT
jgi:hypothetical protein